MCSYVFLLAYQVPGFAPLSAGHPSFSFSAFAVFYVPMGARLEVS